MVILSLSKSPIERLRKFKLKLKIKRNEEYGKVS